MTHFIYCMREREQETQEPEAEGQRIDACRKTKQRRLWQKRRQKRKHESAGQKNLKGFGRNREIEPARVVEIPDGKIICYELSRKQKSAALQLRQFAGQRIWYEKALAQEFKLCQPEPEKEELLCLIPILLGENGGRKARESLLVLEPLQEQMCEERLSEESYQDILRACLPDRNHYTILCSEPKRYAALAEEACEQEGLLLQCVPHIYREYPLGENLLILNFRTDYRIPIWMLARNADCFTASAQGIVKFLDTTVKNSYNI